MAYIKSTRTMRGIYIFILTLSYIMFKMVKYTFKTWCEHCKIFQYVWPFFKIMHEGVNFEQQSPHDVL